mmetsp:Transcript_18422/g.62724  ORF Transcript_18422/g.62724 Transcript_18422/m.62724 type:complete len:385 (+) Transcript_18422:137-1291(+)
MCSAASLRPALTAICSSSSRRWAMLRSRTVILRCFSSALARSSFSFTLWKNSAITCLSCLFASSRSSSCRASVSSLSRSDCILLRRSDSSLALSSASFASYIARSRASASALRLDMSASTRAPACLDFAAALLYIAFRSSSRLFSCSSSMRWYSTARAASASFSSCFAARFTAMRSSFSRRVTSICFFSSATFAIFFAFSASRSARIWAISSASSCFLRCVSRSRSRVFSLIWFSRCSLTKEAYCRLASALRSSSDLCSCTSAITRRASARASSAMASSTSRCSSICRSRNDFCSRVSSFFCAARCRCSWLYTSASRRPRTAHSLRALADAKLPCPLGADSYNAAGGSCGVALRPLDVRPLGAPRGSPVAVRGAGAEEPTALAA